MNSWRKVRLLSLRERLLLFESLLLLPINGLALRLVSFKRWQSVLAHLSRINNVSDDAQAESRIQDARATARMVRVAAWHGLYRAKCLPQSLTLWWLLRRQGIESDLRFGARKEGSRLEAHAWVEFGGIPLNESSDLYHRFSPFENSAIPAEWKS